MLASKQFSFHIHQMDAIVSSHSRITVPSINAKFHIILTFYESSMIFPVKTPKILAGCDETCVRSLNSFKFCIESYHEHAHLLVKFDIIPCIVENSSCSKVMVRVVRKGES